MLVFINFEGSLEIKMFSLFIVEKDIYIYFFVWIIYYVFERFS